MGYSGGMYQLAWPTLEQDFARPQLVNVLTHYGYETDIASESVRNSAVRKLPIELENKRLFYLQRFDPTYKSLGVLSAWLKNIAQVQENIRQATRQNQQQTETNQKQPLLLLPRTPPPKTKPRVLGRWGT